MARIRAQQQYLWGSLLCALVSYVGCGGRTGDDQDDLSQGGAGLGGRNQAVCDHPVSVETYQFLPSTRTRDFVDGIETCFEATPQGPLAMSDLVPTVLCRALEPGESAEISAQVALTGGERPSTLEYSLLSGADHITVSIEHDRGTLECPTLYQDNAVNFDKGYAFCVQYAQDGRPYAGNCPCAGVPPDSLSSIRAVRWEAFHDATSPLPGRLCVARRIRLCTGDCGILFER